MQERPDEPIMIAVKAAHCFVIDETQLLAREGTSADVRDSLVRFKKADARFICLSGTFAPDADTFAKARICQSFFV